ncbi:hypothetical protein CHUAL_002109 [Chamberlinius hualienensis]
MDINTHQKIAVIVSVALILPAVILAQSRPFSFSPAKGCFQTYATSISVYKNQLITFSCPICTKDWTNVNYQWFYFSHCKKPAISDPCWILFDSSYSITLKVTISEIYRCVANGTFKNISMSAESGSIQVDLLNRTVEDFCKSTVFTSGTFVITIVVSAGIVLIITIAVALHFVCKRRIAKASNTPGREPIVSCVNIHREINHCQEEFDEEGYIIPMKDSQTEAAYMEITDPNERNRPLPTIPNVEPKITIGFRKSQPNYYENTKGQKLTKQNKSRY